MFQEKFKFVSSFQSVDVKPIRQNSLSVFINTRRKFQDFEGLCDWDIDPTISQVKNRLSLGNSLLGWENDPFLQSLSYLQTHETNVVWGDYKSREQFENLRLLLREMTKSSYRFQVSRGSNNLMYTTYSRFCKNFGGRDFTWNPWVN